MNRATPRRGGLGSAAACGLACASLLVPAARTSFAEDARPMAQLRVTTTPDAALISCNRAQRDVSPLTITDLEAGEHLLVARKEGFRETRRTVTLAAGQRMAVELKLDPILGLILVHGEPPGTEVEVDGASRGTVPLLLTDLPLGNYRVRLTHPGYLPKEIDLHIRDRAPMKIRAQLTSDSAKLTIRSDPAGAGVLLNGISKGTTPCTLERIPAGTTRVDITIQGFEPYSADLKLVPGQEETLTARLNPIPAELRVVTIPPAARVYVNGEFRGDSPQNLTGLLPGTYQVRAEHPGYDPVSRTVTLRRADAHTEELRLEKNCGQLEITTQPAGVRIFIDGKDSGVTSAPPGQSDQVSQPLRIEGLPPGAHEVTLTKMRYHDEKMTIQIERDKTATRHQKLRRRFIPDYEVRTATEVYQGVLLQIDPKGDVKIEILPGILKTIPAKNITSRGPLRSQPPR